MHLSTATGAMGVCAPLSTRKRMLRRTLTSLLLLAFGLPGLLFGGPLYFLVVDFYLLLAAWEYIEMTRAVGSHASRPLVVGGVFAITVARAFFPEASIPVFTFLV